MEENATYIAQYLAGELSPEEARAFEQKVQADPDLRAQLREEALMMAAIRQQGESEQKSRWDALPLDSASVRPLWKRPAVWLVAASILLIGLIALRNLRSSPPSPQELFATHYTSLPLSSLRGEEPPPEWEDAREAYLNEDYPLAKQRLLALEPDSLSQRLQVQRLLFLGMAHMELKEYAQARLYFAQIPAGNLNRSYADWYAALSWLGEGDVPAAKKALGDLASQEGHYRQKEAGEILQELE